MPPTYVVDTGGFYGGLAGSGARLVTTTAVWDEVRRQKDLTHPSLLADRVEVREPTAEALTRVHEVASTTSDLAKLSPVDLSLLALAVDVAAHEPAVLVSDDYAVANVAAHLGIAIKPAVTRGIQHRLQWEYYCPACHTKAVGSGKRCRVCGTPLKRRVRRSPGLR